MTYSSRDVTRDVSFYSYVMKRVARDEARSVITTRTMQRGLASRAASKLSKRTKKKHARERKFVIVQELCESRGGRPGLSVLTSLLASVD